MAGNRWGDFAEALKTCRNAVPLSQKELASKANLSVQAVKSYEKGPKKPHASNVRMLADALGLVGEEREEFIALGRGTVLSSVQPEQEQPNISLQPSNDNQLPIPLVRPYLPAYVSQGGHAADCGLPLRWVLPAVSLLVMLGLALLSLVAITHWRTVNYESTIPYTTAETFCPGTSTLCHTAEGSVRGSVHMVCWEDAIGPDSQQPRWFYIQAVSGSEGFVLADDVIHQITVPRCTTISWINATIWALGQDGQTTIPPDARNNSATYWSSENWGFSYDAWKIGAGYAPTHAASTAQQTWNLYKTNGAWHTASSMPPRGSLVFFTSGRLVSVAVSLGDGWVETTQGTAESQKLPVTHKTLAQIGVTQLGYVPPDLI